MEKLIIDKMRDIIIIEKSNDNIIEKGSKFYCGCCGNILGESKKKLKFPFTVESFNNSVKNKSFNSMLFGLRHKTCEHTMFSFQKEYGFVTLETYLKNTLQVNN